jgi:hypothetical protein
MTAPFATSTRLIRLCRAKSRSAASISYVPFGMSSISRRTGGVIGMRTLVTVLNVSAADLKKIKPEKFCLEMSKILKT